MGDDTVGGVAHRTPARAGLLAPWQGSRGTKRGCLGHRDDCVVPEGPACTSHGSVQEVESEDDLVVQLGAALAGLQVCCQVSLHHSRGITTNLSREILSSRCSRSPEQLKWPDGR